ncbi:hypothetical protein HHL28_05230 [Aerophototrophica crusticola]|uniref:Uncharacterized protein n=1 Tax=Aerophototrophica crusticola TaxID=1709002 RepID=A0A858R527_9PROT|nr:hypothetical protein HHL28_05230 [Rhodospirillaceae bacterium B3]
MRLTCYPIPGSELLLRPAPLSRPWMEATPDRFAYRCLPLNIANTHGWEVLCPAEFTATWDGSGGKEAIRIESDALPHHLPVSHFGSGVLTFHVPGLFRTPPGLNLWVGGPPNLPKDGIQALSAVVETDWAPYTFTMNWLFTRPHHPVRFAKGEPFCFFFPLSRGLVEEMEPEVLPLDSAPELAAQYRAWSEGRADFLEELPREGSAARAEEWQKAYFRGRLPDGRPGCPDHRTKLSLNSFRLGVPQKPGS